MACVVVAETVAAQWLWNLLLEWRARSPLHRISLGIFRAFRSCFLSEKRFFIAISTTPRTLHLFCLLFTCARRTAHAVLRRAALPRTYSSADAAFLIASAALAGVVAAI
jgi:hypothetical protein